MRRSNVWSAVLQSSANIRWQAETRDGENVGGFLGLTPKTA
ncbi:hypothetical protein U91I_02645 [alpha proteobacterium U9-1i]|nr:hypothetical protein U91I_02645 [alpha proteobacterium U9-1i]